MRRFLLLLCFLAIPGIVAAGFFWRRDHAPLALIEEARSNLGTRTGSKLTEELEAKFPSDAEVQYLRARQLSLDGKHEQAKTNLQRAATLGWPSDQIERERALLLSHDKKTFRDAEPKLQDMLSADPEDHDVLLALAKGYTMLDRSLMAEKLVDRVLEKHPDDGAALCLRGSIRLKHGAPQKAYADLVKAVGKGQGEFYWFTANLQLANCLRQHPDQQRLGGIPRAYKLYKECSERDPNHVGVLYGLGICSRILGSDDPAKFDEALTAFHAILRQKSNEDSVDTLLQIATTVEAKARVALDRNDKDGATKLFKEAIDFLKRVEEVYPEEPQMLAQMSRLYAAIGDDANAKKFMDLYEQMKKAWQKRNPPQGGAQPNGEREGATNPEPTSEK